MKKKAKRRLGIESLERRDAMAATIFESEPNDRRGSADLVTLDAGDGRATVQGSIGTDRDQDFFRLNPTAGGTMSLRLADNSTLAAKIAVEDIFGNKLFESEPNNGVTSGEFTVRGGVPVFIRVRGQSGSIGDYTIQLGGPGVVLPPVTGDTTVSPNVLETESNNTKATANRVFFGRSTPTQIEGIANTSADRDFFRLRATVGGTVNLSAIGFGGNVKFSVEDSLGNKLFESEPNRGINAGSFVAEAGRTYFLRVRTPSAGAVGYRINLSVT